MKLLSILVAGLFFVSSGLAATVTITSDSEDFDGIHGIADASGSLLGEGVGAGFLGRMTVADSVVIGHLATGNLTALNDAFQLFGSESDGFALNSRGANGAFEASVIADTRVSVNDMGGKSIWLWLYKGTSRTDASEIFLAKLSAVFPTDPEGGGIDLPLEVYVRPSTIVGLFSGAIGPGLHDYYGPPDGVAVAKFRMQAVGTGTGNQPPVAQAGTLEVFAGIPKSGQLVGSDPDDDDLVFVLVSAPTKGMVVVNPNGSFTYTAEVGQLGADSFTYKVNDGSFDSSIEAISITITEAPPNSAPMAIPGSFQMVRNDLLVAQLSAVDADGDSLTYALGSVPANGTVQVRGDGVFSYRPANGFVGEDSFSFTTFDGIATSAPALVVIVVGTQTPNWTWMNGSSAVNQNGVYGNLGVAAPTNTPGARSLAASASKGGVAYVFGGVGRAVTGGNGLLSDLWQFDSTTNEWTWLSGAESVNQVGAYGTQGQTAPTNQPGGRSGALMWIDDAGKLWLFGGFGRASTTVAGELNDLWRFDPESGEWVWVAGGNGVNTNGVYGTRGVASATTVPGGRTEAVGWLDGSSQLWLFGGRGRGAAGSVAGLLNDLWRFDVVTGQWTHVQGGSGVNAGGVYHDRPSASSQPGGRSGAAGWIDPDGSLWLYGGRGLAASGKAGNLGDLWVFNPRSGAWSFANGSDRTNSAPLYGELGGESAEATPGARFGMATWLGADGHLYLFGGSGRGTLSDVWRFDRYSNAWSWIKGHNRANQVGVYGQKGMDSSSNSPGSRAGSLAFVTPASQLWLFAGAAGTRSLNDVWRLTLPQGPSVHLDVPVVVSDTSIDLDWVVRSNSTLSQTSVTVEYATASFANQRIQIELSPVGPGLGEQSLSTTLTGLTAGTDYEVRVVVENAGGRAYSPLRRFRTSGTAPAPTLSFVEVGSLAEEAQGLHTVEVALMTPATVAFDVPVSTGGTATSADFQLLTPRISFIPGQVRALIDVRLIDNTLAGPDKTLGLTLGTPSDPAVGLGSSIEHTVTIRDDDASPTLVVEPVPQLVAVGGDAEFTVIANGQGPFSYQWRRGASNIANAVASVFQKTGVRLADAGHYSVEVSSARGKSISSAASLGVVEVSPSQVVAEEGGSATLSIVTAGSNLTFAWRKVGSPTVLGTSSSLSLSAVTLADSGDYQCTVGLADSAELAGGLVTLNVVNSAPTLPFNLLPSGYVGSPYAFQIEVGNAPEGAAASFVITGLPSGLRANSQGLITGIPQRAVASQTVLIRAINPVGATVQVATITILGVPPALVGSYVATISPSLATGAFDVGGRLDLTTTSAGSFSATLQLGTARLRAKGPIQVSATGAEGSAVFIRRNAPAIEVAFLLAPLAEPGEPDIEGTAHDGQSNQPLKGVRLVSSRADRVGLHSFGLLLDESLRGALSVPQGAGFGTANFSIHGRVAFAGRTADGGIYTSSSIVGREGEVPVYLSAPILRTDNVLTGSVHQEVGAINGLAGDLRWTRVAASSSTTIRSYRSGFHAAPVMLHGGLYAGPAVGAAIAGLPAGNNNVTLALENRALIEGVLAEITFTIANAGGVRQRVFLPAAGTEANPASISFNLGARPAGSFNGAFTIAGATPALARRAAYQGLFVRLPSGNYFGAGYFMLAQPPEPGQTVRTATEMSGEVIVEAAP